MDSDRSQYDGLIAKLNDIGIGAQLRSANVEIVERAFPPGHPYSPRLFVNLAIALVLASLIAGAVVYVLEVLDKSLSSPDQVETDLGLDVLGLIPNVTSSELSSQLEQRNSALSEAYRSLRTSLQFSSPAGTPSSLLITSAEPREAKSTMARKLAIEFAALGTRVLLVDCDLRKPNLHHMFGTDNALGLSSFLANLASRHDLRALFRATDHSNLTLVTSGSIPTNPADLLLSHTMPVFLNGTSKHFDLVILDGPPVIGLSDAPILAHMAEATLFVVSHKQVAQKTAIDALARLRSAGANVIGAAMTQFKPDNLAAGGAYKYLAYDYGAQGSNQPNTMSDGKALSYDTYWKYPAVFGDHMRHFGRNIADRLYRAI